jgi:hypothetical protein
MHQEPKVSQETARVASTLIEIFAEQSRVVFWQDPSGEFREILAELDLGDVEILRLDERPALEVKIRLEQEDPTGRYLLYAPFDPPSPERDWLLDMRLYSASFSADRASMLLSDLGLTQHSLRAHLAERAKFLANKERLERLRRIVSPNDSALDIDRKIIAVLARADQPEFFNVLISLFDAIPEAGIDAPPPAWGWS